MSFTPSHNTVYRTVDLIDNEQLYCHAQMASTQRDPWNDYEFSIRIIIAKKYVDYATEAWQWLSTVTLAVIAALVWFVRSLITLWVESAQAIVNASEVPPIVENVVFVDDTNDIKLLPPGRDDDTTTTTATDDLVARMLQVATFLDNLPPKVQ